MNHALPQRDRISAGFWGLALALVALLMQLAAASVVPLASPAASVERLAAASICHRHGGAPPAPHTPDCAVCPLCQAIAHAGVLLGAPIAHFAAPVLPPMRAFPTPQSRAVQGPTTFASSARGPPGAR